MSLLLFSGAGRGVRTSALIIQLLTLLSERLQQNGRLCCLSKLYQASLLAQTCDIRLWVSQPARVHSSWENASTCQERTITLVDYDSCKAEELWMIFWMQTQEYGSGLKSPLKNNIWFIIQRFISVLIQILLTPFDFRGTIDLLDDLLTVCRGQVHMKKGEGSSSRERLPFAQWVCPLSSSCFSVNSMGSRQDR